MERKPEDLFRIHDLSVLKSPMPAHLMSNSNRQGSSSSPNFPAPVRPTPKQNISPFGLSALAANMLNKTPTNRSQILGATLSPLGTGCEKDRLDAGSVLVDKTPEVTSTPSRITTGSSLPTIGQAIEATIKQSINGHESVIEAQKGLGSSINETNLSVNETNSSVNETSSFINETSLSVEEQVGLPSEEKSINKETKIPSVKNPVSKMPLENKNLTGNKIPPGSKNSPESKTESKTENKTESKTESKSENKMESKAENKMESKAESKISPGNTLGNTPGSTIEKRPIVNSGEITLTSWSMVVVPNNPNVTKLEKSVTENWIVLVGRRPDMTELWHSSLITNSLSKREITTGSGRIYRLEGPCDDLAMIESGFNFEITEAFRNGFPENWQMRLVQELGGVSKGKDLGSAKKPLAQDEHRPATRASNDFDEDKKASYSKSIPESISDRRRSLPNPERISNPKKSAHAPAQVNSPKRAAQKANVSEQRINSPKRSAQKMNAPERKAPAHTPARTNSPKRAVRKADASELRINSPKRSTQKMNAPEPTMSVHTPAQTNSPKRIAQKMVTPKQMDSPKRIRRDSEPISRWKDFSSFSGEDIQIMGHTRSGRRVVQPLPYWENKYLRSYGSSPSNLIQRRKDL